MKLLGFEQFRVQIHQYVDGIQPFTFASEHPGDAMEILTDVWRLQALGLEEIHLGLMLAQWNVVGSKADKK